MYDPEKEKKKIVEQIAQELLENLHIEFSGEYEYYKALSCIEKNVLQAFNEGYNFPTRCAKQTLDNLNTLIKNKAYSSRGKK